MGRTVLTSAPLVHQDDAERNKKIVLDLLRRPENAFCADCGAKGTS